MDIFKFNSSDIPTGKGFRVEVIYGDDISEDVHGTNSPSNIPEIININIPK